MKIALGIVMSTTTLLALMVAQPVYAAFEPVKTKIVFEGTGLLDTTKKISSGANAGIRIAQGETTTGGVGGTKGGSDETENDLKDEKKGKTLGGPPTSGDLPVNVLKDGTKISKKNVEKNVGKKNKKEQKRTGRRPRPGSEGTPLNPRAKN